MDVLIVGVLVAALFGVAGRRVALHHGRSGALGFAVAALVPPAGVVAAIWALAADLPPASATTGGGVLASAADLPADVPLAVAVEQARGPVDAGPPGPASPDAGDDEVSGR